MTGSSPRMRGKPYLPSLTQFSPRLIPAYAGKTRCDRTDGSSRPAHPRVCGENLENPTACLPVQGSSPRMRGKRRLPRSRRLVEGLIPAYAGKTTHATSPRLIPRAHPRVCGENNLVNAIHSCSTGSSPRMRGKLGTPQTGQRAPGLIPAYAGKTTSILGFVQGAWAHPRVCGENFVAVDAGGLGEGSSPRMRGKLHRPTRNGQAPGLIPAYAGKTLTRPAVRSSHQAHPRVCGENSSARPSASPLVWLIPAYAGKTPFRPGQRFQRPAHPRVCGENLSLSRQPKAQPGSSPRMRGKRSQGDVRHAHAGLIPAYAGKTGEFFVTRFPSWAHPRVCGENLRPAPAPPLW